MIAAMLPALKAHGVREHPLPGRSASHRRVLLRRDDPIDDADAKVGHWPSEQRALALSWLREKSDTRRWDTLAVRAGNERMGLAARLVEDLLTGGWIALEARRVPRREWEPWKLHWLRREHLAVRLGMPDSRVLLQQAEHLHESGFVDPRLPALADSVKAMRPDWRLKRMQLLHGLDQWLAAGSHGTRRQFALFARGATKQITGAEWDWLDDMLGLETLGIEAHTPGLWLRAPLRLHTAGGVLDLRAVPDAIALTPATLTSAVEADGTFECWRVVENRTSFEQAARAHGARDGVLWLPGFAPSWWLHTVRGLLRLAPAPLRIACDPDPAGIRIALSVAALWHEHGLHWQPWRMDADDLLALPRRRPLNDYDRAELVRLSALDLCPQWARLLAALPQHGKGEQEGFDFSRES